MPPCSNTEFPFEAPLWPMCGSTRSRNVSTAALDITMLKENILILVLACNVLIQDTAAMYKMTNFGQARNCTISALFPAVVSLASLRIGGKSVRAQPKVNYDVGTELE